MLLLELENSTIISRDEILYTKPNKIYGQKYWVTPLNIQQL